MAGKWSSSLFDCCSPLGTCCLGSWAPCCLYGKTQSRLSGNRDPGCWNGSCVAYGFLMWVGVACCLQCSSRGKLRNERGISGNACNDFMASFCCPCCDLIQQDKESRVELLDKSGDAYISPQGMAYPQ